MLVKRIVRHVIDDTIVVEPAQSPTPVATGRLSSGAPVVVDRSAPVSPPAPAPVDDEDLMTASTTSASTRWAATSAS